MPVTKTAKRALRSSKRKAVINKKIVSQIEAVIRTAKKGKKSSDIIRAISLTDRAKKKHVIHKNKAARIKSALSKLLPKQVKSTKTSKATKTKKSTKKSSKG